MYELCNFLNSFLVGSQIVVLVAQMLHFVSKKETKLSTSSKNIITAMKTTSSLNFYFQAPTIAMDSSL
jgi:hypothetical protein